MAKVTKKKEVEQAAEWAEGSAPPQTGFVVAVDIGQGAGRELHLDFELDAKPRKRIELPVPNSDDAVVIVPDKGHMLNETRPMDAQGDITAIPCIVTMGKDKWLCDYILEPTGARIEDRVVQ